MSRSEVLKKCSDIKKMINLNDDFISKIKDHSFLTGSFRFGVENNESDIDVIVSKNCSINFKEAIDLGCVYLESQYSEDEFHSCYGLYEDRLYNFLFMNSEDAYDRWLFATNKMALMVDDDISFKDKIKNKEYRIKLFESLKEY